MDNLLSWFRLKSTPGIGNHLIKRLIDRFDSPEAVFDAPMEALLIVDGMSKRLVKGLIGHRLPESCAAELDETLARGYQVISLTDAAYPALLRQIPDPPPFLYIHGHLEPDSANIAVVGSRNATNYGITTTRRLASDLARRGLVVVSGMARGIDTAAHSGALAGGGQTYAILGGGLERIYPPENRPMFDRIAENGAVISEFPLKTGPDAFNFPARNRIISGMSLGTIIVEASKRSGSLITARLAAEQGREVYTVPGSIHSFKSSGTHGLIKDGATLVEHAQDVIDELSYVLPQPPAKPERDPGDSPPLSSEEQTVCRILGPYPTHIDDLVRKLSVEPGKLASVLLNLELKGLVEQSPGKLFSIKVRS